MLTNEPYCKVLPDYLLTMTVILQILFTLKLYDAFNDKFHELEMVSTMK